MLKKGITHGNLLILQLAKQMKLEDVSESLIQLCAKKGEVPVQNLIDSGYLELIKGKTSDSFFRRVRLTKKGAKILDALETPLINEDDLLLFEWLSKIYIKRDKNIGNAKRTKTYLALFRVNSGIEKNALAYLLKTFIDDDKEQEFSHVLQNVFFKSDNLYSTKFDIEQSRLYQYYLKNKSTFDEKFKNLQ